MSSKADPTALAECVVALDDEGVRMVHAYWYRVVREMAAEPVVRPVGYPAPFVEDIRRERREARRALARVVSASRPGTVAGRSAPVEVAA